tara:strand:- start:276 stop:1976 length:1701 start_codon:yes stop_codon:yes gene_type:complete
MNLRKELRKSLLSEQIANPSTIYYCCDGSNLLACNAGGPAFEQWVGDDNVIELDMYDPPTGQNPMNMIYAMAQPGDPDPLFTYPWENWTSVDDYTEWCNSTAGGAAGGQVGAWCDVVVNSVTKYPKGCGGYGLDTFGDTVSMKQPKTRKGDLDRKKKGRAKEQTTSGAAGAYSQPIFGEPMKRKINEERKRWWEFWKKRGPEDGCPCEFNWNGSEYVGSKYRERCCEYGNKVDVPKILQGVEDTEDMMSEDKVKGDSCCTYKIVVTMDGHGDNGTNQKMYCSNCSCQNAGPCKARYSKRGVREQTLNPGAGINTQTINGGQCAGDIVPNYTVTSGDYGSLMSAFVHLVNNYGMSADFRDYAFPTTNGDYVNLEIDINMGGNMEQYFSIEEIHESFGTGPFTTVQALLSSQNYIGGSISLGTLLCTGVDGVDNSLPTVGLDSTGMGDGPGMPKAPSKKMGGRSMRIKESEFIKLIEKSIYAAKHGGVIKEALTDADEKRIGVLARKELKDYETKLEKKIDQMIKKALKGKDFETNTLKITRNALIQLYKALWIRRSFWTDYIKNTPS